MVNFIANVQQICFSTHQTQSIIRGHTITGVYAYSRTLPSTRKNNRYCRAEQCVRCFIGESRRHIACGDMLRHIVRTARSSVPNRQHRTCTQLATGIQYTCINVHIYVIHIENTMHARLYLCCSVFNQSINQFFECCPPFVVVDVVDVACTPAWRYASPRLRHCVFVCVLV